MEKKCGKCKEVKPFTSFTKDGSKKDGLSNKCRTCKASSNATFYNNNKTIWQQHYTQNTIPIKNRTRARVRALKAEINEYKQLKGCQCCSEKTPVCLDFHHTDNNKVGSIANLVRDTSIEKVWLEIEKCVVLCANCHRKLHAGLLTLKGTLNV